MKALSVFQPWASLVAAGVKRIDTRCWRTGYRGTVAIYALDKYPQFSALNLCEMPSVRAALAGQGIDRLGKLPLGAIVGTVELVDCRRVEDLNPMLVTPRENLLGNYSPGRWAWVFRGAVRFRTPVAAAGGTGLWEWRGEHEHAN